jgi:ABC-type glycerol-3-phosphate transport system substrate-binding protein
MHRFSHRAAAVLAATVLAAACSQPPPKPATPPPPATPKLGVVALVGEVKHRGLSDENWRTYFGKLFSTDTDHNVTRVQYEVTVLYDDGSTGTVIVDEKPSLQAGQKVRVTGNRIEPIQRR